jgi:aryl-alcohol dehydrogenase-like predicted oxidoreductase
MIERTLWNGTTIPALGLGCWAIGGQVYRDGMATGWGAVDDNESIAAIRRGLDLGIRFFDTANAYGGGHSEEILGQTIGNRADVFITTKFGNYVDPVTKQGGTADRSPAGIKKAAEDSLRRLRRDRIDLYLLHVNSMPIAEAALMFDALDRLKAAGKIDVYGWSTDFPERAAAYAERRNFEAIEHSMNVFFRATALVEVIEKHDLLSLNRGPLAMGLLTGKFTATSTLKDEIRAGTHAWLDYFQGGKPNAALMAKLEAVRDLLRTDGRTLAQGALAWLWARSPNTLPIPGFRTIAQVEENAGALAKGPLAATVMAEIERVIVREPEGEPRER